MLRNITCRLSLTLEQSLLSVHSALWVASLKVLI